MKRFDSKFFNEVNRVFSKRIILNFNGKKFFNV